MQFTIYFEIIVQIKTKVCWKFHLSRVVYQLDAFYLQYHLSFILFVINSCNLLQAAVQGCFYDGCVHIFWNYYYTNKIKPFVGLMHIKNYEVKIGNLVVLEHQTSIL